MKRDKPPHPRNIVGKHIRQVRKATKPKVSQEDLCGRAAKYGVLLTRPQIAKIEAGRRPVFDYEALAISKALKVPLVRLFGIQD